MVDELEERERALKKAKVNQQKEEAARREETEKIKDQGRRLREEKMKEMEKREQEANQAAKEEDRAFHEHQTQPQPRALGLATPREVNFTVPLIQPPSYIAITKAS